jgi:hypothetical protein
MTFAAPPRTIHYPLAAKVVGYYKRHGVSGDYRTVEQRLELDDADPDDSRYYAAMVAGGWTALAVGVLIATLPIGYLVGSFGDEADHIVRTVSEALSFFCLAGAVNALWHMAWHVPQARRRLRKDGADSKPFKKSMRRSLPRNTSLIFQTAVAILVLILAL